MREAHSAIDRNIPMDAPVWRYFDFAKFAALLQHRSLYFSRADLLGDPLEGSVTQAYAAQREELLLHPPAGHTREDLEATFRFNEQTFAHIRLACYVNCWHMGDHESMAMWHGYGGGLHGIAIRSTFDRLDQCLPERFYVGARAQPILIGKVTYVDYSSLTERLPHEFNVYGRLMCKSLPYRHETELRAIFTDVSSHMDQSSQSGHYVPVPVEDLVERIVVSPLAPKWFTGVIKQTCAAFGYTFNIASSIAGVAPVY